MIEYMLLLSLFSLVAVPGVGRLRSGSTSQLHNTQIRLAGSPAATTPPPTTRPQITTTTLGASRMVVNAGPDIRVAPGQTITQPGSITSPGYPVSSFGWSVTGANVGTVSSSQGVSTGTPEAQGTSLAVSAKRPGIYYLNLWGTNASETKSDFAEMKVTSGVVTPTTDMVGSWADAAKTRWYADAWVDMVNQYNEPVAGLSVQVAWTRSTGKSEVWTCITDEWGECWLYLDEPASTTWVSFEIKSVSGPCLDSVKPFPAKKTTRSGNAIPYDPPPPPDTVVTTTTTTAPPTTTTTAPPASTTTRKKGPNG